MKIKLKESAYKDLKKLDKKIAKKILNSIKELQNFPNVTNIKKLKNFIPAFRYRVGDYRILFDINEDVIYISHIKHRKKAYEGKK